MSFKKLLIVLILTLCFLPIRSSFAETFSSKEHAFSIEFPDDWELNTRKDVVVEATPGKDQLGVTFNIIHKHIPEIKKLTELKEYQQAPFDVLELISADKIFNSKHMMVSDSGEVYINDRRCLFVKLAGPVQIGPVELFINTHQIVFLEDDDLYILSQVSAADSPEKSEKLMLDTRPLFRKAVESLYFFTDSDKLRKKARLIHKIKMSFFFFFAFGMPLLLRFVIFKEQQKRNKALILSLALWVSYIIMFSLFKTAGKPHLLFLLLAVYSFFILRKKNKVEEKTK